MAGGRQGAPGFDARRLRSAREAAALTQGALAQAADVHINEVVEWEAGRRVPRVDAVAALARALRVSPLDLLDRDDDQDLTLHQLRVVAGLSQQQTAERARLLRTTYSGIERGLTAHLAPNDAAAIARALRVEEDQVRTAHAASRAAYLTRRGGHTSGRGTAADD